MFMVMVRYADLLSSCWVAAEQLLKQVLWQMSSSSCSTTGTQPGDTNMWWEWLQESRGGKPLFLRTRNEKPEKKVDAPGTIPKKVERTKKKKKHICYPDAICCIRVTYAVSTHVLWIFASITTFIFFWRTADRGSAIPYFSSMKKLIKQTGKPILDICFNP